MGPALHHERNLTLRHQGGTGAIHPEPRRASTLACAAVLVLVAVVMALKAPNSHRLCGCPKNASGVVPLTEVVCDRGHRGSRAIARPFKPPACVTVRLPGPAEPVGLLRRDDPRSHGPSDCNSPVSYGFERQYPRAWVDAFLVVSPSQ